MRKSEEYERERRSIRSEKYGGPRLWWALKVQSDQSMCKNGSSLRGDEWAEMSKATKMKRT